MLELARGKVAVEVGWEKDLVPTLELIKTAVLNGELDKQIDAAANKLRDGFAQSSHVDHSLPILAQKLSRIGDWGGSNLDANSLQSGSVLDAIQHHFFTYSLFCNFYHCFTNALLLILSVNRQITQITTIAKVS